ncbi:hypothetical protein [Streptomyces sp. IBSBF 2390]|uniref:hypothetical protein n=1 Tax=Streptomyces sp. IBSBF 2390 TaxID=2903533 RepID=UPI002FDBCD76
MLFGSKATPESFPELHAEIVRLQALLGYHEFEGVRADLTDMGRQLLNRLLTLSPHQRHRSTTWTPRRTAGRT